jgi:hypothetical protein
MLSSITPLGERSRGNRWWLTVTAYLVGATLGGAVTGTAFGVLGLPLRWLGPSTTQIALVAVVLGLAALAFDASGGRLRLPRTSHQVNEDWTSIYRGWVYGFGWGFELGMGLVTVVTAATIYLVFALAFLTASPALGALIGATFGLARGLVILSASRVHSPDALLTFHRRLQESAAVARAAAVGADALVVVAAVTVAVR